MVVDQQTKATLIYGMVEFRHSYLTGTYITPGDRITHGLVILTSALQKDPDDDCNAQLKDITNLLNHISKWQENPLTDFPAKRTRSTPVTPNRPSSKGAYPNTNLKG